MVTFGADPDAPSQAWEDDPGDTLTHRHQPRGGVLQLCRYFMYHPRMKMDHVMDNKSQVVLGKTVANLLKHDLTPQSIQRMMDAFYSLLDTNVTHPAYVFASYEMQQKLSFMAEFTTDPVYEWILDGMLPTAEEILEIHQIDLKAIRTLLIQSSVHLSYPELVHDILAAKDNAWLNIETLTAIYTYALTPKESRSVLAAWTVEDLVALQRVCNLPPELLASKYEHVRRPAPTFTDALMRMPIKQVKVKRPGNDWQDLHAV